MKTKVDIFKQGFTPSTTGVVANKVLFNWSQIIIPMHLTTAPNAALKKIMKRPKPGLRKHATEKPSTVLRRAVKTLIRFLVHHICLIHNTPNLSIW